MKITFAPRGIVWVVWMKALFHEIGFQRVTFSVRYNYVSRAFAWIPGGVP
jgi:hypothetical protein